MDSQFLARRAWLGLATFLLAGPLAAQNSAKIGPEFTLRVSDLTEMTAGLPPALQEGILRRPAVFLHEMAMVLDQPPEWFVLVDKHHPLSNGYVPDDLVSLKAYPVKSMWPGLKLRKAIMPAVLRMVHAAKADGVMLTFSSTYRSYEYQEGVFQREVQMYGLAAAERESARAGYSQHQLGTVVDFGSISDEFEGTPEGKWVAAHAWEYGFSLSYPQGLEPVTGYRHESWHYRYITREGTTAQRDFFGDVQQYFLEFLSDNRLTLERSRRSAKSD